MNLISFAAIIILIFCSCSKKANNPTHPEYTVFNGTWVFQLSHEDMDLFEIFRFDHKYYIHSFEFAYSGMMMSGESHGTWSVSDDTLTFYKDKDIQEEPTSIDKFYYGFLSEDSLVIQFDSLGLFFYDFSDTSGTTDYTKVAELVEKLKAMEYLGIFFGTLVYIKQDE